MLLKKYIKIRYIVLTRVKNLVGGSRCCGCKYCDFNDPVDYRTCKTYYLTGIASVYGYCTNILYVRLKILPGNLNEENLYAYVVKED